MSSYKLFGFGLGLFFLIYFLFQFAWVQGLFIVLLGFGLFFYFYSLNQGEPNYDFLYKKGEKITIPPIYEEFDEKEKIFINQNGYGCVVELQPMNTSGLSEKELEHHYKSFKRLLNTLPSDLIVQFFYQQVEGYGKILDEFQNDRSIVQPPFEDIRYSKEVGDILQSLKSSQIKMFQDAAENREYFRGSLMLPPKTKQTRLVFYKLWDEEKEILRKVKEGRFEKFYFQSFKRLVQNFLISYEKMGVQVRYLNSKEFMEWVSPMFGNPYSSSDVKKSLGRLIVPHCYAYDNQGIFLNENDKTRVLFLSDLPPETSCLMLEDLKEVDGNFEMVINFQRMDDHEALDKLSSIKAKLRQMNPGLFASKFALARVKDSDEVESIIANERESLFKMTAMFSVSEAHDAFESEVFGQIKSVLQTKGIGFFEDAQFGANFYLLTRPFYYQSEIFQVMERYSYLLNRNLRAFLSPSVFGGRQNSPKKEMMLVHQDGSLASLCLQGEGARHGMVTGPSGSGKSVVLNRIILDRLSAGAIVRIIDFFPSYQKLCEATHQDFYKVSLEEPPGINPLAGMMTPEKLSFCTLFYCQMVKLFDPETKSVLQHAIQLAKIQVSKTSYLEAYHEGEFEYSSEIQEDATLSNVLQALGEEKINKEVADTIYKRLLRYKRGGEFGDYFDKDYPPKKESSLVCWDLSGLGKNEDLKVLTYMMLCNHVLSTMKTYRGSDLNLVLTEEVQEVLGGEFTEDFLKVGYETFRKLGCSFWVATPMITNLIHSPAGLAVLQLSKFRMTYNPNNHDGFDLLKKKFGYDEKTIELIKTLKTVYGDYAEFYFDNLSQNEVAPLRLVLSAMEYALFTTDAKDLWTLSQIALELNCDSNDLRVLKTFAERYPRGVGFEEKKEKYG